MTDDKLTTLLGIKNGNRKQKKGRNRKNFVNFIQKYMENIFHQVFDEFKHAWIV